MFSIIDDNIQRNALEKFYKENKNCFLNTAYSQLHNKNDAEDAVQEAFCDIARHPDKFFGIAPKNRVRYMIAVIRNISTDMYNKKHKIPSEVFDEGEYLGDAPSFEDIVIGEISKEKLKIFIKSLPALQRDVLTFRCLLGFSTAETAAKLNISQSAVKKRLHLARKAILEYIRKENEIYE